MYFYEITLEVYSSCSVFSAAKTGSAVLRWWVEGFRMTPLPVCQKHVTQTHTNSWFWSEVDVRTRAHTDIDYEPSEIYWIVSCLNQFKLFKHIKSQKAGESQGATTGDVVLTRSASSELLLYSWLKHFFVCVCGSLWRNISHLRLLLHLHLLFCAVHRCVGQLTSSVSASPV